MASLTEYWLTPKIAATSDTLSICSLFSEFVIFGVPIVFSIRFKVLMSFLLKIGNLFFYNCDDIFFYMCYIPVAIFNNRRKIDENK